MTDEAIEQTSARRDAAHIDRARAPLAPRFEPDGTTLDEAHAELDRCARSLYGP